jgi:hypothetical protein
MKPKPQSSAHDPEVEDAYTRAESHATLRVGAEASPRPSGVVPVQRFEDRGEIARGGMSSVRCVFDNLVLREVAMKVLEPTRDFDALARFVEEAQITGQLDHPNIVPIHDIEMDDQGLPTRFTMKLVRGETLADLLGSSETPLSGERLEEFLQSFLRVCDAVAFAHSRGVIHRDLKPSNIMIGTHGQVYVMDWGVALLREGPRLGDRDSMRVPHVRSAGDTLPEALGSLTGTPSYMAPEQARGEVTQVDERTDVYGLGGILYFLLTQRAPHDADSIEASLELAKAGRVVPPERWTPEVPVPPFLSRIARRALAADPADRYPSVAELKRDIEAFLRGGGWFAQQSFAAGTTIVKEGDAADAAYIITHGQCELYRLEGSGEGRAQRAMCELGPGEVFGETAIFTSSTRMGTIVAKTDVTTLVVTRAALERELSRNEWLGAFVRAVAERFVDLDRQLSKRPSDTPR